MKKMSENVFKVRSHAERVMSSSLNNQGYYKRAYNPTYSKRVAEDYVNDSGVILKRHVPSTIDVRDTMSKFRPSDFMIDNIIAVGALDSLKSCQYVINSVGELSDNLDPVINNVISAVDSAESKNE